MPRLWIMYIEFLLSQRCITITRRVIDRALRALPVTQHQLIWDVVINKFVGSEDLAVPVKTSRRLLERYLQFEPGYADAMVSFLIDRGDICGAVEVLINRMEKSEVEVQSRLLLLIELISKNSNTLKSLTHFDLPGIIRTGLARYPDKQGELWNSLSDYYIRMGIFSKAIEVYEEGMETVMTVEDFALIFDSYQSFLFLLVQSKLDQPDLSDVHMFLRRLDLLLERRGELLSSVVLRQNPNNVIEWIKRSKLPRIASNPQLVASTFMEAINVIGPHLPSLVGRVSALWIEFGKFFAENDIDVGRKVFEKAISSDFRDPDDLAAVWIEWILMELRLALSKPEEDESRWSRVLEIARRSISQYRGAPKGTVQSNLFKVVKLWHLVIDVEESVYGESKPDLVRTIYDAMMEHRVVTVQSILNYAQFEKDRFLFEKAAQVLERGISLFSWPHCRDIWLMYLGIADQRKFSTERMRDLYQQVLSGCDAKNLPVLLFAYFKFELQTGFANDCIAACKRASEAVPLARKEGFFWLAMEQAMNANGAQSVRKILQEGVDTLTEVAINDGSADRLVIELCLEYARIEVQIGHIERARKLMEHAAQFVNPSKNELAFFWELWKNFEIEHGTQETFKEMKRVQRAVAVQYSEKHFNTLDVGVEPSVAVPIETAVSVEAPAVPAAGIDLSKLKQMAMSRKQESASTDAFISAPQFEGSKPGYAFKAGAKGLGYYRDT
jgi:pre-mRNA-splicing factor SYF1